MMSNAAGQTTELSTGAVTLIVLPAVIALVGVVVSTIVASVTAKRSEERRSRNVVSAQVLEAGRQAELDALYLVADFVAAIKNFNQAMSGNTGVGADDEQSAAAFEDFISAFDGFDPLTRASMTVQTLGAMDVSERITTIRDAVLAYVMSLEPPVFKAEKAMNFEKQLDGLMEDLVATVRLDFGTDAARSTRPNAGT